MREEISKFLDELNSLPGLIQEKQLELLKIQEDSMDLDSDLQSLENEIRIQILESVNEDGKKTYPNDQSRDGAFKARSSQDEAIVRMRESIKADNSKAKRLQFEIEMLSNRQRNIRSMLNFSGGSFLN